MLVEKPKNLKVKVKVALAKKEVQMIKFAQELFPELPEKQAKTKFFNLMHNNRYIDADILNQIRIKLTIKF